MRPIRDFRPQQLYGVTQRGNQGQWVYRDDQDFRKALDLMARFAARYGVNIHGWCLMHNHGHWIFEASSEDSISNLMRDILAIFEPEVSEGALEVIGPVDFVWATGA